MAGASALLLPVAPHGEGALWAVRGSEGRRRGSGGGTAKRLSCGRMPPALFTPLTRARWQDWRSSSRIPVRLLACPRGSGSIRSKAHPAHRSPARGQYEEQFGDVDKHLLDYFTYKAVKTVLAQLHEMDTTEYSWFQNFVVDNKPQDSELFLRTLVKEKQELGEKIMVTRLRLFNKWVKRYNHENVHAAISDQNLELLREHLVQTVKWPSDADDNKEL